MAQSLDSVLADVDASDQEIANDTPVVETVKAETPEQEQPDEDLELSRGKCGGRLRRGHGSHGILPRTIPPAPGPRNPFRPQFAADHGGRRRGNGWRNGRNTGRSPLPRVAKCDYGPGLFWRGLHVPDATEETAKNERETKIRVPIV